jgi:hypothetical protein
MTAADLGVVGPRWQQCSSGSSSQCRFVDRPFSPLRGSLDRQSWATTPDERLLLAKQVFTASVEGHADSSAVAIAVHPALRCKQSRSTTSWPPSAGSCVRVASACLPLTGDAGGFITAAFCNRDGSIALVVNNLTATSLRYSWAGPLSRGNAVLLHPKQHRLSASPGAVTSGNADANNDS